MYPVSLHKPSSMSLHIFQNNVLMPKQYANTLLCHNLFIYSPIAGQLFLMLFLKFQY